MDGVFTRCDSVDPATGKRCIRLRGHEDSHMHPVASSWDEE